MDLATDKYFVQLLKIKYFSEFIVLTDPPNLNGELPETSLASY